MGVLRGQKFGIITLYSEKERYDQKVKTIGATTVTLQTAPNYFYGNRKGSYWIDKITAWQFYVDREYSKQRKIDALIL